jgi:hypothetical protein
VTINSSAQLVYLRAAGYFIAFATMAVQLVELVLRAWPVRLHSAAWRLGFISNTAGIELTMFLMILLVLGIAVYSDDRPLTFAVCAVSWSTAVLYLAFTGAFAMDVLQMRNQVQMSVSQQYDVTSVWTTIRLIIGSVGFALLGLGGLRSIRSAQRSAPRPGQRGGTLVVGTGRYPTPAAVDETAGVNNS